MNSTPFQIGHHVDAYDKSGRTSRPGMGFATEVWADFNPRAYNPVTGRHDGEPVDSLANARKYATEIMERYPSIYTVTIRESIQQYEGCSWNAGRCVETITRPEPEPEHDHSRFNLCYCGYYWE